MNQKKREAFTYKSKFIQLNQRRIINPIWQSEKEIIQMVFGHGFHIPPLCCNSWFEILLKIFAWPNSVEEQGVNRKHPVPHNKECKATIHGE